MNNNTSVIKKPKETFAIIRIALIKSLLVVFIAFAIIFILNLMMQSYLDREVAEIAKLAEKTARAEAAITESNNEAEIARLRFEADRVKAEQAEAFYQKYKNRGSYQDYGQFYELYTKTVSADIMILGTSHATHGINPKYLEEVNTDYKFYNFALNGSNPTYYYNWYTGLFREADYPKPQMIIMSVDWFMFDDGWLWRRLSHDDSPDRPVDIMRKLKATEVTVDTTDTEQIAVDDPLKTEDTENSKKETINIFDIDAVLENLFSRIAVIYARDRIFEMLGSYLIPGSENADISDAAESENETETANTTDISEEIAEFKLPVYEHPYLVDGSGFVTSDYYHGYIPWESAYAGHVQDAGCNDNPSQISDFKKMLDIFEEERIPVIFVMCPEYIPGRNAPQFNEKNDYLIQLAAEYGIPFLNYNTDLASEINDDYGYYSDWGHMNTKGSTSFSRKLAEDITEYLP